MCFRRCRLRVRRVPTNYRGPSYDLTQDLHHLSGFSGVLFDIRFPRIGVGGGFGVDAEVPDVEVHAFLGHHFYDGVFARLQWFGGGEFEPASGDAGRWWT